MKFLVLGNKKAAIDDFVSAARLGESKAKKWLKSSGYKW